MSTRISFVRLGEVVVPVVRAETPIPGKTYRQIGVRLWGEGAYEREPIDGSETRYAQLHRAEADDVIVNKIWARNGSVAVVSGALAGSFGSSEFPMFKPKHDRIDARWLHWLTKTPSFWEQCDLHSRGTSGQNRIRPERFLEIQIPLPPLVEQRRIVAQIEELATQIDEACTLRQETKDETEALSHSCAEAEFERLRDKIGTTTMGDICVTITDGDHNTPQFTEHGVRFIFVGNVSSGHLHFENSRRVSPDYFKTLKEHRLPERGDILYSAVGATLGIPAIVESDEPFCFQRHIAILKPDRKKVDSRYVWHMLSSRTVFEKAWGSTTGSAQPTIPLRAIRQLPIPLPPLPEQGRIVAELDAIQAEVNNLKTLQAETAAELDALLPSVLNKAFNGEL